MTGALLDRPGSGSGSAAGSGPGFGFAPTGRSCAPGEPGGGTLEDLLNETLRETRTSGAADCPVCHARMTLTRAHAECGGCGSRLS
jgi:hypothetical protein